MTLHSTRAKLRHQAEHVLTTLKNVMGHLKEMEELGEGRSDYINIYLPILVKALLEWENGFKQFEDGL